MATLTVSSLSITSGTQWPMESSSALVATRVAGEVRLIEDGFGVPSYTTEATWSGTPSVQVGFGQ